MFKKKDIPLTNLFPKGFTDIHSHFLPGIDDGSKTIGDSLTLIKRFKAIGIKHIITTPHVMGDVWPNSSKTIIKKLKLVRHAMAENKVKDITINAAAEYLLDSNFETLLKNRDLLTLKDGLILVELSYFNPPINLYEMLFNIQVANYKPILAHPERYRFYHNDFAHYDRLKEAGCLFQLNLLALTTYYGEAVQNIAVSLLKKGYYDFAGTDVHHKHHIVLLEKIGNPKLLPLLKPLLEKNLVF